MTKRGIGPGGEIEKEQGSTFKRAPRWNFFDEFLNFPLDEASAIALKMPKKTREVRKHNLTRLGKVTEFPGVSSIAKHVPVSNSVSPVDAFWAPSLCQNLSRLMEEQIEDATEVNEMLSLILRYADIFAVPSSSSLYRLAYTAHIISHVIKARNIVLANKKKLDAQREKGEVSDDFMETLRDQGFVRPIALILVPFRKDAFEIVEILCQLVFSSDERANVAQRKRFEEEYGDNGYRVSSARMVDEEFKELMEGNVDDCFRMGIAFSRKELKLYAPFSKADIILCSPLGLRMTLNGDAGDNSHLISSTQIVVVDKCDVLLQQNWENVLTAFKFLNEKPTKIETDIGRVRSIYLEDKAKFYCQSLFFSAYQHEQFLSLAMLHTFNHRGLFLVNPPPEGVLNKVDVAICQELHRINVDKAEDASDARFNYFKDKVLGKLQMHTLVFIPSYFDFVRVRNYLKKSIESFVQCHEYAPDSKVTRARDLFYHGEKKLLLLTERLHFYKRYFIRGVKNVVFYQLPNDPSFYADIVNMSMPESGRMKAILPYSKFDRVRLANVFGQDMANSILKSEKQIHAIVSD